MGFNSAFKGLTSLVVKLVLTLIEEVRYGFTH